MNRPLFFVFTLLTVVLLGACSSGMDDSVRATYQELSWVDLKPQEELAEQEPAADQNSERQSLEIVDDWYSNQYAQIPGLANGYVGTPPQAYSAGVVAELDGQSVRVPGFIVPVEFEPGNLVTEFFLVPYFGACFHKPPPPSNQTIYVKSEKPVAFESIYDPVWVMGIIETKQISNDIAVAAYTMNFHFIEAFVE